MDIEISCPELLILGMKSKLGSLRDGAGSLDG